VAGWDSVRGEHTGGRSPPPFGIPTIRPLSSNLRRRAQKNYVNALFVFGGDGWCVKRVDLYVGQIEGSPCVAANAPLLRMAGLPKDYLVLAKSSSRNMPAGPRWNHGTTPQER
jgi:hypothetical protein